MSTAAILRAAPRGALVQAAGAAAEARAADAYNAGDYDGALGHFLEARRLGRESAMLHGALGTCYLFTERNLEAIAAYRMAIHLGGVTPDLLGNLIFLLDLQPETTLEDALEARKTWWRLFGMPLRARWSPHGNAPDPERPLRIGYVSGDFRRHSAAMAFAPVVLRHSEGYRPVCYSTHPDVDNVTENFVDGTEFHRIAELDHDALAAKIRADRIDILVDLSGFSARHRLETFCRRPAPVQVTGWGYALGTGLPVMDGFFADAFVAPPEVAARGYLEPLLYLPCIIPFSPMPYAQTPGPLPGLAADAPFTFGSFNRHAKVTPLVLETWAEILAAVPKSRLLLKARSYERPEIRRRVLAAMTARGVDPLRVIFRGHTDHTDHLATFQEVDLALDPFPHSGGVTAAEGLWAGVPPLTLLGERIPERLSASLCTLLNLKAFIVSTRAEYIEAAMLLATKFRPQLAQIRATLQHRMAASPLCTGYAETVERHYRDLWRRWCQRQAAA